MTNPNTDPAANQTPNEQAAYTDSGWTDPTAESAQRATEPPKNEAEEAFREAKEQLRPLAQRARQMMKSHPVLALGAGFGLFWLAARLMR